MYDDPKSMLQLRINEALNDTTEETMVKELLKLSLLKKASKSEDELVLTEVYNLLGIENFTALLNLLDGRTFTPPSRNDFKEILLTVLVYYYRDVQGLAWRDIKTKLGPNVNSVKLGIKASTFSKFLQEFIEKRGITPND